MNPDSGLEDLVSGGICGHGCSVVCVFFVLLVLRVSVWLVAPRSPLGAPQTDSLTCILADAVAGWIRLRISSVSYFLRGHQVFSRATEGW